MQIRSGDYFLTVLFLRRMCLNSILAYVFPALFLAVVSKEAIYS